MLFLKPIAPQGTPLWTLVADNYQDWLEVRRATKRPVCWPVRREFQRFMRCGDPSYGHVTLGCQPCGYTVSFPLPCKRRGWCPTCLEYRMRTMGRRIIDDVLGDVPVRHWVLGLPPQLKQTISYNPVVLSALLKCFVRQVFVCLRRKAKRELGLDPLVRAHPGAISVIHLASGDLTPNTHFHLVVADGVFLDHPDSPPTFRQLTAPTTKEIAGVASRTCRAACRMLARNELLRMTRSTRCVIEGTLLVGDERGVKFFGDASTNMEGGASARDGAYPFHVWAGHPVAAGDRGELEELVHYVLAPPIRHDQVSINTDGSVILRLKRQRGDGTLVVRFTPYEFLDALAELVPRALKNTVRYHGVYAPNGKLRSVAVGKAVDTGVTALEDSKEASKAEGRCHRITCPRCDSKLQLVELVSPRFTYQNANWIRPDTPMNGAPAASKTVGEITSKNQSSVYASSLV